VFETSRAKATPKAWKLSWVPSFNGKSGESGRSSQPKQNERHSLLCFLLISRERYNIDMPGQIPPSIHGQKYISLGTFRKNGTKVATPVWFGEDADKLYVMTRSDMGKTKRIRNNPRVTVAPCTIRGKVTGSEFAAVARILPPEEHAHARQTINLKYWMARLPLVWWRTDTYLEVTFP
jgi:hypothetical protein